MTDATDVLRGPLQNKYPAAAEVLAEHPEWAYLPGRGPTRPPTPEEQARYDAQDAAERLRVEAEAHAENAARSQQPAPAEPLPAPEQVAAQVTADEAAHAGETLPGPAQTYGASTPAPPAPSAEATDAQSWFQP